MNDFVADVGIRVGSAHTPRRQLEDYVMRSRLLVVAGAVVVALGGVLAVAPTASADQTWYQSVDRPSASAPCPVASTEDSAAGWSPWVASWEEWPNTGHGGFVCTRSVTWAHEGGAGGRSYPSGHCERRTFRTWVNFLGGWSLPAFSPAYGMPDCTDYLGAIDLPLVYAPDGEQQASVLCEEAFGTTGALNGSGGAVWVCPIG